MKAFRDDLPGGVRDVRELTADDIDRLTQEALDRGELPIWTIYDRPRDHPQGYIARMFVVGEKINGEHKVSTIATDKTATGTLLELRQLFAAVGLDRIGRSEDDEPQIVESWL